MAITSIHAGTNPAAAIQKARTNESEQVKGGEAIPQHARAWETARDAVEIDGVHFGEATEPRQLTAARAALRHGNELSDERRTELLDRVRSGFYSKPDVIEQTAERMADELKSGKTQ